MNCPNCHTPLPANARFCGNCGAVIAESRIPASEPPKTKLPASTSQTRLPLLAGGVGVVALCLFGLVVVILLVSGSNSDPLLIAVQDELYGEVTEILLLNDDEPVTIGSARNGYTYDSFHPSAIAPDGQWMALLEIANNSDRGYELNLASLTDNEILFSTDEALCNFYDRQGFCGFSSNSKYFAYTLFKESREEASLSIINNKGEETLLVPDLIFLQFFSDNQRVLLLEYQNGEIEGLAWTDLNKGEINTITRLSDNDVLSSWPVLSPDNKQVYLVIEEELMGIPVDGGSPQRIYQEVSDIDLLQDLLAVYTDEGAVLLNPEDNSIIPLERNAEVESITRAESGDLVGYLIEDSNVTLYVVDEDGENKTAISEANDWIVFAFSPDGKQIAFIETENFSSGDLYIANVDGSERLRLATDVQSFQFTEDGRRIIYSEIDGQNSNRPESTIYSIRTNGKGQEVILEAQNGILTLLTLSD